MSTAHTPAPWYISTADGSGDSLYVGGMVLQSPRTAFKHRSSVPDALAEIDRETLLANAYLIAAAPELLTALKDLRRAYINLLESGRDRIIAIGGTCDPVDVMEANDPWLREVTQVIAKATGSAA